MTRPGKWFLGILVVLAFFEFFKAIMFFVSIPSTLPESINAGGMAVAHYLLLVLAGRSLAFGIGLVWTAADPRIGPSWLIAGIITQVVDLLALAAFHQSAVWYEWDEEMTKVSLALAPWLIIGLLLVAYCLQKSALRTRVG